MSAEQALKQNELTFWETVQVVLAGQGLLSCSYKSACQMKHKVMKCYIAIVKIHWSN